MPSSTYQDRMPRQMATLSQGEGRLANHEEEGIHHQATLSSPAKPELRIRHYISRGNGILVPVIPLDELPLDLHGVPNHLLWEDTRSMELLGEHQSTGTTYAISEIKEHGYGVPGNSIKRHGRGFATLDQDRKMPSKMEAFQIMVRNACAATEVDADPNPDLDEDFDEQARDEEDKDSVTYFPVNILATPQPYPPTPSPPKIQPRPRSQDNVPPIASEKPPINAVPSSRPLPPSGVEPDETRKEFCSYWIRTGECAFTQQGCKYKHEMPPDRLTLKRVFGIDQWPKWWIERFPNDDRVLAMYPNPHRLAPSSGSRGRVAPGRDFMSARSWRTDGPRQPAMTPIAAFSSLAAAARANPKQKVGVSPPKGQGQKNAGNNVSRGDPIDPVASSMAAILHDPFRSSRSSGAPSVAGTDLIDLESVTDHRPSLSRTQSSASTTTNTTTGDARRAFTSPQKNDFPRLFVNDSNEPKKLPKQSKQSSKKSSKQSSKQSSPTSEVSSSEAPRKRVDADDDGDDESGGAVGSTGSDEVKEAGGKIFAVKEVVGGAGQKKKSKKNHGATRQRKKARELTMAKGNGELETAAETDDIEAKKESSSSEQQTDDVKKGKEIKRESSADEKHNEGGLEDRALKERSSSSDQQNEDVKKGEQKRDGSTPGDKQKDDGEKKDVQKENIPPKEQE